jgi:hypothetical protein
VTIWQRCQSHIGCNEPMTQRERDWDRETEVSKRERDWLVERRTQRVRQPVPSDESEVEGKKRGVELSKASEDWGHLGSLFFFLLGFLLFFHYTPYKNYILSEVLWSQLYRVASPLTRSTCIDFSLIIKIL